MKINIFKHIHELEGHEKYIRKIQEELCELAAAISHFEDSKITMDELLNEIADVAVQQTKLVELLGSFEPEEVEDLHKEVVKIGQEKINNIGKMR